MDTRTIVKDIRNYIYDLFFEREDLNIHERILKIILFPLLVIPFFIIGIIMIGVIKLLLPIIYFLGGFLIDIIIYVITGEFKIFNYYNEKINDF